MIDDVAHEPKNKKRAVRRHHNDRIKNKARRVFKDIWKNRRMMDDDIVGRWCDNLAKCSCGGCGNQRKWMGMTLQERKARQSEVDYWSEDTANDWLWEELSDGYWNWLSDYDSSFSDWCWLCDKEFIGMCPSCGCKADYR